MKIPQFLLEIPEFEKLEPLNSGGSGRKYFRVFFSDTYQYKTLILVENDDVRENKVFIEFTNKLKNLGLNVPEIIFFDEAKLYLQEDLGDETLLNQVLSGKGDFIHYYKKVLKDLVKFQTEGIKLINEQDFYTYSEFNEMLIYRDLFYFKNYFLDFSKVEYLEHKLLEEFNFLAKELQKSEYKFLMYRDLQGRNIMLENDKPYFIDYQGAMKGACVYDAISLLWQAKANLSAEVRKELLSYYYQELKANIPDFNEEKIKKDFEICLILRLLQVLGAYGKLGWIQKKQHFLESIKFGIENLKDILKLEIIEHLPTIKQIIIDLQKGK